MWISTQLSSYLPVKKFNYGKFERFDGWNWSKNTQTKFAILGYDFVAENLFEDFLNENMRYLV